MNQLIKSLSSLVFYLAVVVGVIYFVGIMAGRIGIKRAIMPMLFQDIYWYHARLGSFNVFEYVKLAAAAFLFYFPAVNYLNVVSSIFFPPSSIAIRADIALTKLARVEEGDIGCFQISPNCLSIRHSARAVLPWTWYVDHEKEMELPVGVDFTRFVFNGGNEVLAYFNHRKSRRNAEILIEKPDGSGYMMLRGNADEKYVYVIGDSPDVDKCETFKIGFVKEFGNIQDRLNEAARWDSRLKHLIIAIPVNGRSDETSIHRRLDDSRLHDGGNAGRELFANTKEVRNWISEMTQIIHEDQDYR